MHKLFNHYRFSVILPFSLSLLISFVGCKLQSRPTTADENAATCPSNLLNWVSPNQPNWTSPIVTSVSSPSTMYFSMTSLTVNCYSNTVCGGIPNKTLWFPKDVQCDIVAGNSTDKCESFAYGQMYQATLNNLCTISLACGNPGTGSHSFQVTAPHQPFVILTNSSTQPECTYQGLADSPCYVCP